MIYDYIVIGGGIVGLSTGLELQKRFKGARILIIEKELNIACHQTGHNSGVIHAGIYYAPGSLKSKLCREGIIKTKEFCSLHSIKYINCGKLIVATNNVELERVNNLFENSVNSGINLSRITRQRLCKIEPNISGVEALLSNDTAIVDYVQIAKAMASTFVYNGGSIQTGELVISIFEEGKKVNVITVNQKLICKKLIVCGGLQSDRLAKMAGLEIDFKILPFRGEYYQLPKESHSYVNHLIYPAPDPDMPFLGIHLTRLVDGSVTVGPNAVIGFSREGYDKFSFKLTDFNDIFFYSGFWKLISKNLKYATSEFHNSVSKSFYLKQVNKYAPHLKTLDLLPFRSGIRAQAVNINGEAMHDFHFISTDRMLHVCNAPSPAATSAIPISEMIVDKLCA